MTGGDINTLFRVYTAEPDTAGRWSDTDAYNLINESQNFIAVKMEFPEVTATNTFPANQQEFTLPEILKIYRVYLNGQPIVPTDIPSLEGENIEFFDQTAMNFTPLWNTQTASAYPVTNVLTGYPVGTSPYFVGDRPRFYLRGGNIGIVPPPSSAYTLQIDGIGLPPQLAQSSDQCVFPLIFKSAIAWKAAHLAFASDGQLEKAQNAEMEFQKVWLEVKNWKRDLVKSRSRGPKVIAYRHKFGRGALLGRRWR